MFTPKRFDIFSPLSGGCSEGLDAFRLFFNYCYSCGSFVEGCRGADSRKLAATVTASGTSMVWLVLLLFVLYNNSC